MSQLAIRRPAEPTRETALTHLTSLSDLRAMGEAMSRSGFFADSRDAAQAMVKIQAGQELGIPPYASMTGIHIISGKPCLSAGMIAALVKRSGKYDYRVLSHTAEGCSIQFTQGGEPCGPPATFTTADAQAAGVLGNPTWKKFARSMLFARALTFGARTYCPDVFLGPIYVPEEMGADVNEEGEPVNVYTPPPAPANIAPTESPVAPPAALGAAGQARDAIRNWTGFRPGSGEFAAATAKIVVAAGLTPRIKGQVSTDAEYEQVTRWVTAQAAAAVDPLDFLNARPVEAAPTPAPEPNPVLVRIGTVMVHGKRTTIDTDHGPFYTFSNTVGKLAENESGSLMWIAYTIGEHGRTINTLTLSPPKAASKGDPTTAALADDMESALDKIGGEK